MNQLILKISKKHLSVQQQKIKYTLFLFAFLLISINQLSAQTLTGMSTNWSDSFIEWTVYTADEEVEGDLKMRWQMQNDWSQWDYRVGEKTGEIKMKWKDDPSNWEVRGENQIIFAHTKWKNDFSEWRIAGERHVLNLKTRYRNDGNDWLVEDKELGKFEIFTEYEGDPRDWIIVDELKPEVELPLKMAILFLAIYHSSPRQ